MKRLFTSLLLIAFIFSPLAAKAQQPWSQWLADLRAEAVADGIEPQFFDQVFRDIQPNKRVISFDRRQPEHRLTFTKYRRTRADAFRIKLGRSELRKNRKALDSVGDAYGVDPCFIVALWGIESSYGRYMGNFPVIKSLATLAYDARRADFFRKELLLALHILQGGHVSPDRFKGEWAGGSGHPQFLPSSWHKYAVDQDNDGLKDIWTNKLDVFASIANYLSKNGWQRNQPWAITVELPAGFDKNLLGKKVRKTVSEWQALGITPSNGESFPSDNLEASILNPYGGPYFMAFKNWRVIKTYNNSNFYAGTVGYMADSICRR